MNPGDLVRFVGSGWCHALIGGPGEVVSLHDGGVVKVRVREAGQCLGNKFRPGEVLHFKTRELEVVR